MSFAYPLSNRITSLTQTLNITSFTANFPMWQREGVGKKIIGRCRHLVGLNFDWWHLKVSFIFFLAGPLLVKTWSRDMTLELDWLANFQMRPIKTRVPVPQLYLYNVVIMLISRNFCGKIRRKNGESQSTNLKISAISKLQLCYYCKKSRK